MIVDIILKQGKTAVRIRPAPPNTYAGITTSTTTELHLGLHRYRLTDGEVEEITDMAPRNGPTQIVANDDYYEEYALAA